MDISLVLFVLFLLEPSVNSLLKTWIKNQNHPWISADANQCANSKAIFQKEVDGFVYMDSQQHQIQEVVLPSDGAIVLSTDSKVHFSQTGKCDSDRIDYLGATKGLWFSAESWATEGQIENTAQSHIFKIPCECDTVEFPSENAYGVDLQYVDEIVADKILINGHMGDFEQFLESSIGQKMFLNSEAVHFSQGFCHPQKQCGCHNRIRFRKYTDILCEEESKHCVEPHCLEPFTPEGHCCPMCGAILNFKIKDTCEFNMTNMSEVGRKLQRFRNGKYFKKLNWFAGIVPGKTTKDNIVQLVVAEVGEYTGISVEFMDYLTKDERFQVDSYRHRISSGDPYIRGQTSAFLIMMLTFLFVLSIYGVIYLHYIQEPKYNTWIPISRLNLLRRSVAFARFENRRNEDDDDDNDTIDVSIRYENNDQKDEKSVTDFSNPMYEREQVTLGSVETEMLQPTTSTIPFDEPENLTTDIKLVDIALNSIDEQQSSD